MTELYRGLLLVLTNKFNELIMAFRSHVRSFNQAADDPENYFDVGIVGFWNLMLEIVLTVFTLLCLVLGVVLIAGLAITFYLPYAFLQYGSLLLRNTRNPPPEIPVLTDKNQEESPVIIKNHGKEKN